MRKMSTPTGKIRGGAVIMEMVLVLPLLAVVLALMFYLGRGMVRVQRTAMAARSAAWSQVGRGPGPGTEADQLNQMFFAGNAESVEVSQDGYFPTDAESQLAQFADLYSGETGALVRSTLERMPNGCRVQLTVTHSEAAAVWQRFDGPSRHRHTRIEHEWRHAAGWRLRGEADQPAWPSHGLWYPQGPGASNLAAVPDTFFPDFDTLLVNLDAPGPAATMPRMIRGLYLASPSYLGPWMDPQ